MSNPSYQPNLVTLKSNLESLLQTDLPEETRNLVDKILEQINTNLHHDDSPIDQEKVEALLFENAHLNQTAEEANQARAKFISIVSHELRIPMTSIKGYTDLLRQGIVGPVNDQQLNFLDVIRNNVERMSALISDLVDISRGESGHLKLNPASIPLRPQLDEALNKLADRLEAKGQSVEVPSGEMPSVYADPVRVSQVLANLISNANKYSPAGESIVIQVDKLEENALISVTDTGIGISPEDQAHLFEAFFRSEEPAVREEQGWGLSLSVSRLLIENMGGKIGVQSSPSQGSTFWFTVPLQP